MQGEFPASDTLHDVAKKVKKYNLSFELGSETIMARAVVLVALLSIVAPATLVNGRSFTSQDMHVEGVYCIQMVG